LSYLVSCFEPVLDHLHIQTITCNTHIMIQRLEVEVGEMSRFVQKNANKKCIWIAIDTKNIQVIAFHISDRRCKSAWRSLPAPLLSLAADRKNKALFLPPRRLWRQRGCRVLVP
jgi:hypothetical protein